MLCELGVCLVALGLTHVDSYENNMPTEVTAFDGSKHDISRFYDDQQTNLNIHGVAILDSGTRIRIGYDNGIQTQKYYKDDSYTVGVDQLIRMGQHSIALSGTYKFEGKDTHVSCKDRYDREFVCTNLSPWSERSFQEPKDQYKVGIKYSYRF